MLRGDIIKFKKKMRVESIRIFSIRIKVKNEYNLNTQNFNTE